MATLSQNALDFGIEETVSNNNNPFYVDFENEFSKKKMGELYELSDRIIIICLKNCIDRDKLELIENLYNKQITTENLNDLSEILTIVECDMSIVMNMCHKNELLFVEKKYLDYFNKSSNIKLYDNELVLLMLESQNEVSIYSKLYTGLIDLDGIINIFLTKDFNRSNKFKIKNFDMNLSELIKNMKEMMYFKDEHRCKVSINELFLKRKFNYSTPKISMSIIARSNDNISSDWETQGIIKKLKNFR